MKPVKPILKFKDKMSGHVIQPYKGSNVIPGLIAEWNFDGNGLDTSGGGRNLTLVNTSFVNNRKGVANSAIQCVDNTSLIDIGSNFNIGKTFSISFWVNLTSASTPMLFFTNAYSDYCTVPYLASSNFNTRAGTSPTSQISSGVINTSTWYHVVAQRSGTTMTYYLNNVLKNTGTVTVANNDQLIRYLNRRVPGDATLYHLRGILDDVRIYNRILTTNEITQLYTE